ncbi:hypothetical protein HGO38_08755 [Rhizobium sp. CG5]|uniref:hypothetical protein n=1 Tax=Rhizobium sp. CG5 TaxID=2726076 RepID=UPI0020339730|nr:hypothetical protein [Rhizobium sp. CG5]MCM2473567.1 hypothetical protein [Rhizobium sp. CG5]
MQSRFRKAAAGASPPTLDVSETICLSMTANGKGLLDIAAALGVPVPHAEVILLRAEEKLGANNRLHAVSLAMLYGILDIGAILKPE